jgi:signal recognition particle subunit SRP54
LQRPAAIHQLQVLGEQIGIPVHADTTATDPVKLCQEALALAPQQNVDVVLFDTAGRLHIDEELMNQLKRVDNRVQPHQVYLVVDGMTGQDAVNSAKVFNEALELNGVIMTKLDGDARGGAVLSVKAVTGVPIKFLGTGEHLQDLEPFRPDGMASRILGGGDLLEVARRAQTEMDQAELAEQQRRMMEGQFTLDDFLSTLGQIKKLGRLSGILKYLPGMGQMKEMLANVDVDKDLTRVQGMIHSMTPDERRNPNRLIDQSRRRRIAAGAGVQPHEVNDLVKQFDVMADMMKRFAGKGQRGQMEALQEIQKQAMDPRGPSKQKIGTGKRLSTHDKERLRKQKEKELRRKRREERKQ